MKLNHDKLIRFFINIATSGKYSGKSEFGMSDYLIRYVLLNFIGVFGIIILLLYNVLNFQKGLYDIVANSTGMIGVALLCLILARAKIPQIIPSSLLMFFYGSFCIWMVHIEQILGINFLFIYVYPLLSIMLLGLWYGLTLSAVLLIVVSMVEERTRNVLDLQNALLKTMAELVECRDDITGGHIERPQRGIKILMEEMEKNGVYREEIKNWNTNLLLQSCQLHDVGKISISDSILKKPAKLNEEEFEEMKKHAAFGEQIIDKIETLTKESDFLKYAKIFAASHHEKWDGSGYPHNLKKDEIPLLGRIMAIADVYDALTSVRPYKNAFTHEEAVQIIIEQNGIHFDPTLVKLFTQVAEKFR